MTAIARAYRHALSGRGAAQLLDYGDPQGLLRLRVALAEMLSATRGISAGPESLIVTRGSQMALDLVARALVRPFVAFYLGAMGANYSRSSRGRSHPG